VSLPAAFILSLSSRTGNDSSGLVWPETKDGIKINKHSKMHPTNVLVSLGISDLSPNELINLTRLKKGAELLAEGDHKFNEVANMIGYSLPTNFSRDFQRQFGVSPSSYLNTLQK
jgi:AraC-like DNA-binding protein